MKDNLERRLLALKAAGGAITFGTGLLQPIVFSRHLTTSELAYLFTFLGIVTYLSLFDAGAGRAFYITIREKYVAKSDYKATFALSSLFFVALAIVLLVSFSLTSHVLARRFQLYGAGWTPAYTIFSLLITLFALYRPIFYATDRQILYDILDVMKRLISLVLVIVLFLLGMYAACAIACLLALVVIGPVAKSVLRGFAAWPGVRNLNSQKPTIGLVGHSLVYSIAEISIYNFGYFVMPFSFSEKEVVIFGFLMRFYLMLTLIVRVFGDVFLHRFSQHIHSSQHEAAEGVFYKAQLLSTGTALALGIGFFAFGNTLLDVWVDGYAFTNADIAFVSLMVVANSILHVSGAFAGVTKAGLVITKRISVPTAVAIVALFLFGPSVLDLSGVLYGYLFIYAVFSVSTFVAFYLKVLKK
ncbi:hypothetical protein [Oricola sp.]|uniref:hypothetical protein n=1 Tax=Oricola sp. TaxID=1979950 RepID=UPI003BAAD162